MRERATSIHQFLLQKVVPQKSTWIGILQKRFQSEPLGYYRLVTGNHTLHIVIIEGSLEVKLPTIWTDEKQSREEAERRERLEESRSEEKESEERRCRCAKR